MPSGSGQVSPAEFTVGHAVHELELMCVIIYSRWAPVLFSSEPTGSRPAREEASPTEALGPHSPTTVVFGDGCCSQAPGNRPGRDGAEHAVPLQTHPSAAALPEDGLLNISRNSTAKPVNCFLGNTLHKDGGPPAGRAESPGRTTALRTSSRAWLQAGQGIGEKGGPPWGLLSPAPPAVS